MTGGAGFIGSAMALHFKARHPQAKIVAFDNLRRRGSELNLPKLKQAGVVFCHGDIRNPGDFEELSGNFDALIECSAEPSVMAGLEGSSRYVVDSNLSGTVNCLEFAKRRVGKVMFLSTSRVYSIQPLREIELNETPTRFEIGEMQNIAGVSPKGIAESFPTHTARSLYGATKLASEMLVQEYSANYRFSALINRCGIVAGPGQFGKVDQGVVSLWALHHFFKKPLSFVGFGGTGKQVRDVLHIADLLELVTLQLEGNQTASSEIYNVGGGRSSSTSLLELTELCQNQIGNEVPITRFPETSPMDIPLYLSDFSRVEKVWSWRPKRSLEEVVSDIVDWLKREGESVKQALV